MGRVLRWLLGGVLLVALLAALYLEVSLRRALDSDLQYTAAVAALPWFAGDDGIRQLRVEDQTFRLRTAGFSANPGAPAVLLLHGFPVTSAMWTPILEPLVQAGYRVVAPDQRGYSPGARPESVSDYRVDLLAGDVLALADALAIDRFHLVGHDWGAIVGWVVAATAPRRVLSWSAVSIPHPAALADAMESDSDQRKRSRYIRVLRLPWLPEVMLAWNDFAALRDMGERMGARQVEEYRAMFREPGAASAAFNWYRALPKDMGEVLASAPAISVPTLFLWGKVDGLVAPASVAAQSRYLAGPYREVALEAGHRVVQSHPDAVSRALLANFQTTGNEGQALSAP